VEDFWNALDNREKSLLIWTGAFLAWALTLPGVRSGLKEIGATLVRQPLGPFVLGALLYVTAVISFAAWAGYWTLPLIGVTVLWCLGPGAAMFGTATTTVSDSDYVRGLLRSSLTWLVLVEFLTNLYVLPLLVELVLVPVLTLLVVMAYLAGTKDEYASIKLPLDVTVALFGIGLVAYSVISLAFNYESFATLENLLRLVLPVVMTVAFIPYAYFLRGYSQWEQRRFDLRRRAGWAVE
jgi:hypothetical protein